MSPKLPDPMDDVLDELLLGADEDLRESLDLVLDVPRGCISIIGAELAEEVPNRTPRRAPRQLRKPNSVEDCINRIEALLTALDGAWDVWDGWADELDELDELRSGLVTRGLSRHDANHLIDEIERGVMVVKGEIPEHDDSLDEVLDLLSTLRLAVARLFDDSRDGSVVR